MEAVRGSGAHAKPSAPGVGESRRRIPHTSFDRGCGGVRQSFERSRQIRPVQGDKLRLPAQAERCLIPTTGSSGHIWKACYARCRYLRLECPRRRVRGFPFQSHNTGPIQRALRSPFLEACWQRGRDNKSVHTMARSGHHHTAWLLSRGGASLKGQSFSNGRRGLGMTRRDVVRHPDDSTRYSSRPLQLDEWQKVLLLYREAASAELLLRFQTAACRARNKGQLRPAQPPIRLGKHGNRGMLARPQRDSRDLAAH